MYMRKTLKIKNIYINSISWLQTDVASRGLAPWHTHWVESETIFHCFQHAPGLDVNKPMADLETGTYKAEFCSAIILGRQKPRKHLPALHIVVAVQVIQQAVPNFCEKKQWQANLNTNTSTTFSPFEHLRLKRQGGGRAGQIPSLSRSSTVE